MLLGASNLSRGLATVMAICRQELQGGSLELLTAAGWGRSYGTRSGVLGRTLPGIAQCGLWTRLTPQEGAETFAVVTDVGNDLAFGVQPALLAQWVGDVLVRLKALSARTVLVLPPVEVLESLPPWRFSLVRWLYFSRHRISRTQILVGLREVVERLRDLGDESGAMVMASRPEWYGWDPIHVARNRQRRAWEAILGSLVAAPMAPSRPLSWRDRRRLALAQPERQWLLGIDMRRPQPALRWGEGHTLELY